MSFLKCFTRNPSIPRLCNLLHHGLSSTFAHTYSTAAAIATREKDSFTVNYLIRNCGFSPEAASAISHRVPLKSSENPDFVLSLFKSCGFSNSQIRDVIRKAPRLLRSDPAENIWPKLDFLLSKGASCSQLANIVTKSPGFLLRSLENHIIPCYNFVKGFVGSDKRTVTSIIRGHRIIYGDDLVTNINLLLDIGVRKSGIAGLLYTWPSLFTMGSHKFRVAVEGIKELGLDPSKSVFIPALYATSKLRKSVWNSKVDLYKCWGWSEEEINRAFALHPYCMLKSVSKIKAVMEFFVNDMGWDSSVLARNPMFFSMSLKKRIIPRAYVLRHLHSSRSIKNACIVYPFYIPEEMFLEKYVNRFEDKASQLLKLYEERMKRSK